MLLHIYFTYPVVWVTVGQSTVEFTTKLPPLFAVLSFPLYNVLFKASPLFDVVFPSFPLSASLSPSLYCSL